MGSTRFQHTIMEYLIVYTKIHIERSCCRFIVFIHMDTHWIVENSLVIFMVLSWSRNSVPCNILSICQWYNGFLANLLRGIWILILLISWSILKSGIPIKIFWIVIHFLGKGLSTPLGMGNCLVSLMLSFNESLYLTYYDTPEVFLLVILSREILTRGSVGWLA